MEKVKFVNPTTNDEIEFFVVEQTQLNGTRYLFVTEQEEGDCDAYILREVAAEKDEIVYEMVEDDRELNAIGRIFAELVEDADIEYEN